MGRRRVVLVGVIVATLTGVVLAQRSPRHAFDSASIKANPANSPCSSIGMPPGGRFTVTCLPVHGLIRFAYDLQDFQVVGVPPWVDSALFDVQAKAAAAQIINGVVPIETVRLLVQQLLADRFKLAAHREVRQLPIYALVMFKGRDQLGPQLHKSKVHCDYGDTAASVPADCEGDRLSGGHFILKGDPLSFLALHLSTWVEREVVDKTGLPGDFDLDLQWTVDTRPRFNGMGAPMRVPDTPPDPSGISLFTALQEQLGLKLEATRGPINVMVIDHVERPTED